MAMILDSNICYRALAARDPRFDGLFFVGVTTTGIYCRPTCPARVPGADRCRFYPSAAAAEADGFRPCLRCRPEKAPGRSPIDAATRLAGDAAARIAAGALNHGASVDDLAASLHTSPRQLRRAVRREYGVSPVRLAQTHRLLLAKTLLTESSLSISEVAFASGFSSVRRFNALFRSRYRLSPTSLRRGPRGHVMDGDCLALQLEYRPPLDWDAMLDFLAARAIPGVETVRGTHYARTVTVGTHRGWIRVGPSAGPTTLRAEVSISLTPVLMSVLARIRDLFDLDAEPQVIESQLAGDPLLAPHLRRRPGLRVPGAMDGFELALRAVLGQQVSVAAATTLSGRLAARFADAVDLGVPGLARFPIDSARLAEAPVREIASLGMSRARAECISHLARAHAEGGLYLEPGSDVESVTRRLQRIPGIGPWTAQYILMRALHWPDAFPQSDLGVRRALVNVPVARLPEIAEGWRPWRAYATMYLWRSLADSPEPDQSREEVA